MFLFTFDYSHAQELGTLRNNTDISSPNEMPVVDFSSYESLLNNKYSLFPHKGTYLLPYTYNWTPHQDVYAPIASSLNASSEDFYQRSEAEFQISFMIPVYRNIAEDKWDLLFAYTHHAWWQIYNSAWSRPFRETNYMPELFFRHISSTPASVGSFYIYAYDFGYVHQSNGQIDALSRSWDRAFARFYVRNKHIAAMTSVWWRLPEQSNDDDNPNIIRYMGVGEVELYKVIKKHSLSLKVPFAEKIGVELKYSYPWRDHLRWFVDFKSGYGHSLIEYNKPTQRIGMGISLENFFDQEEN